ncbi:Protein of unknown function [Pyronema omphalodes CBS 100304]|uniref:Uncharacterized protein n=1 Tax=Pyronema omphalodes (strain CBS 100304) TaxID=1076935 RepID=U4LWQ8_PYROM|nr:Protein of unknown function [Pyronema omphalodes CBS 100304]
MPLMLSMLSNTTSVRLSVRPSSIIGNSFCFQTENRTISRHHLSPRK